MTAPVLLRADRPQPRNLERRIAKRNVRRDPDTLLRQRANVRGVIAYRMGRLALWRASPPVPDRPGALMQMRGILAAIRRDRLFLPKLP